MIGRIRGILIEKQPPELVVDVQGVGYEIFAPMTTFYTLPNMGNEVILFTHFIPRDDGHYLYGFHCKQERTLFKTLIKVNGVGPKMALAILSGIEPHVFAHCIETDNTTALVKIPGVGKKTAERLVIEMRDKLKQLDLSFTATDENADIALAVSAEEVMTSPDVAVSQVIAESESALVALGYKPQDAAKVIAKLNVSDLTTEQVIRQALKSMA